MPVAALIPLASKGSFLISTNVGIMIWTIVVFAISLFILRRAVFPRIGEALDKRAKTIEGEIDAEATQRAQREIEVATKRALDDLRKEVSDLTIMATEKVTRKSLDESDQ